MAAEAASPAKSQPDWAQLYGLKRQASGVVGPRNPSLSCGQQVGGRVGGWVGGWCVPGLF